VITEMLTDAGIEHDLESDGYRELRKSSPSEAQAHLSAMIDKLCASMTAEEIFHRAQAKGLLWASVRYPEENIDDPHFQARGTFQLIDHPELNRKLKYPVSVATDGENHVTAFTHGAPRLGEHTQEVLLQAGISADEIATLTAEGAL
jgi:crotonobetainyl-CoA:carnitine CoA-transferase CaiB-like acyl-CoA transferase